MPRTARRQPDSRISREERELLGAALRYAAVAEWFEKLAVKRHEPMREQHAMDAFNRVEEDLRLAARRAFHDRHHRQAVLEGALEGGLR